MTREELLEQRKKLCKDYQVELIEKAQPILALVQSLADKGFTIKLGSVSSYGIEFNFDRGDDKNFGLDFKIYYNSSFKAIEISHSCGLSAGFEYMKAIRPHLIQRDKVVARMWEHEATFENWFLDISKFEQEHNAKIDDIDYEIRQLDYKARQEVLAKLKVGMKICFAQQYDEDRVATIVKIARKYVTFNGWWRKQELSYLTNRIVRGEAFIVE